MHYRFSSRWSKLLKLRLLCTLDKIKKILVEIYWAKQYNYKNLTGIEQVEISTKTGNFIYALLLENDKFLCATNYKCLASLSQYTHESLLGYKKISINNLYYRYGQLKWLIPLFIDLAFLLIYQRILWCLNYSLWGCEKIVKEISMWNFLLFWSSEFFENIFSNKTEK